MLRESSVCNGWTGGIKRHDVTSWMSLSDESLEYFVFLSVKGASGFPVVLQVALLGAGGAWWADLLVPCLLPFYYISSVFVWNIWLIISCNFFEKLITAKNILRTKRLNYFGLSANLGKIAMCTVRKKCQTGSPRSDFYTWQTPAWP